MIKISVIVPVYNVEKYIDKCLNSLKEQTLKDIEFIIVNDGSPDKSQKIIDKYVKKDKRFKSIIKNNGGQGSARNEGIKVASGEYIAFVDSDDYVSNQMFEKMYKNAKENNSDIVVCGNYCVDTEGNILKKELLNISDTEKVDVLFDKTAVWNKIYKKTFLDSLNVNFREKKWYEDFDYSIKILLSTDKIYVINECLYYYLQREGSTMNNNNLKRNLEIFEAFNEILSFIEEKFIYDEKYCEIEFIAIMHLYLATNVRIICSDTSKKEKLKYIKEVNKYFCDLFPNYKKNKYIKTKLSLKKKIIMYLLNLKMYSLIKMLFKLKK